MDENKLGLTNINTHSSIVRISDVNVPHVRPMISKQHTANRKILTVALAVILGLGILANSGSALSVCGAACCTGSSASVNSHHTTRITATAPGCCCSDIAASPCEYSGGPEKQLSSPALLRVHQHDHRDLTVVRMDAVGTSTGSPETAGAPAVLFSASILKVPIYLTTLTFLC